jgi:hypothetical protein
MLLGNATSLSYDIGIFDDDEEGPGPDGIFSSDQHYRRTRLQYLCYVYIHSFSARYGRGSALLPKHVTLNTERWLQIGQIPPYTSEEDWKYLKGAVGLTKLMKNASELLFVNKRTTRDLLRTGGYISLLSHFEPLLQAWRQSFEQNPRKKTTLHHVDP